MWIEDSVNRVNEGERLVDESGKSLDQIMSSVKKVSNIVTEIAVTTQEQSQGIDQINIAVVQIDKMTQQNVSLVEESASTSLLVGSQANHLNEMVSFFQTTGQVINMKSHIDDRPWTSSANDNTKMPTSMKTEEQTMMVKKRVRGTNV